MKLLLINPPWSLHAQAPLNLAELAAYLMGKGHCVEILDLNYELSQLAGITSKNLISESLNIINAYKFDMIGITSNIVQFPVAKELIIRLKRIYTSPVIVGGIFAWQNPGAFLGRGLADYVVTGEGEIVLDNLLNSKPAQNIKGLAYYKNGKVVVNPPQPLMKDLKSLGIPAFGLIKNSILKTDRLWLSAGRGCAYKCAFCCGHGLWQYQRMRPVANVIKQVKILKRQYKKKFIVFGDDCLTLNKKWFKSFCAQIKKTGVKWGCLTRIDTVDKQIVKMMAASGCVEIFHGIESASAQMRAKLNKSLSGAANTNEKIFDKVAIEIKHGIKSVCSFMVNLPGETKKQMGQTFAFAKKLQALDAQTQCWILTSYDGTEISKKYKPVKFDKWKVFKQRSVFGVEQYYLFGNLIEKHFAKNPDMYMLKPEMGIKNFVKFYLEQKRSLEKLNLEKIFSDKSLKTAKALEIKN
jgi:radical SAM superfamily enzyme YgiQ (UPF0313 family)